MRIFTGIQLVEEARKKIIEELAPFRKIAPAMRWTERNNIHLTIKFIGEVAQDLAGRIAEVLAATKIAIPAFHLRIRGFGKFPAGAGLHILWAGVEDDPHFLALFNAIETMIFPLGIARETRPFHPHLTLGRSKARDDFRMLGERLTEKKDLFLAAFPVTAFQLIRSDLTPSGPVYSVLKEIPLDQS